MNKLIAEAKKISQKQTWIRIEFDKILGVWKKETEEIKCDKTYIALLYQETYMNQYGYDVTEKYFLKIGLDSIWYTEKHDNESLASKSRLDAKDLKICLIKKLLLNFEIAINDIKEQIEKDNELCTEVEKILNCFSFSREQEE